MAITEGEDTSWGIPRRSIATRQHIPNIAIFLKRTTIEFLQILFGQREPGSFKYDQDDTITEIQICDLHSVDLNAINVRPSIVLTRGPLSWQKVGIGDIESRNTKTGAYTFNDLLIGSVAISCISREGIEAEEIGHLVFNSFKFFRPQLQKYGFFTIRSLNIGAETLVESEGMDDKTTIVPIFVTAAIQDRWVMEDRAAKKLEQIVFETLITNI
jgi:hypothetical protein